MPEIIRQAILVDIVSNLMVQAAGVRKNEHDRSKTAFRENEIICLRYGLTNGDAHTLDEIGSIIGVTSERIRQVQVRQRSRLRYAVLRAKYGDNISNMYKKTGGNDS
jgi:hypothetical protein